MSTVDVTTTIRIGCSRWVVAEYTSNPDNAPKWYKNIDAAQWLTPRPLKLGSRIAFRARFLGRHLTYAYEIVEFSPLRQLVMRTAHGPFPIETTYRWDDALNGETIMTLRNRGRPAGIFRLLAPLVSVAIRRANTKDLEWLKRVLETRYRES
jgi:hypothetical protein